MWLSEEIVTAGKDTFQPRIGHVTKVDGHKVTVSSDGNYSDIPVILTSKISSIPEVGEEVIVFPMEDGAVCSALAKENTEVKDGEIYISNGAGAYVWLKSDGTVEINGQIFKKEA